ncbi:hypothetical protein [Rarobacter incanus]|nr:hypothetical protein [Rarobacter incanus]
MQFSGNHRWFAPIAAAALAASLAGATAATANAPTIALHSSGAIADASQVTFAGFAAESPLDVVTVNLTTGERLSTSALTDAAGGLAVSIATRDQDVYFVQGLQGGNAEGEISVAELVGEGRELRAVDEPTVLRAQPAQAPAEPTVELAGESRVGATVSASLSGLAQVDPQQISLSYYWSNGAEIFGTQRYVTLPALALGTSPRLTIVVRQAGHASIAVTGTFADSLQATVALGTPPFPVMTPTLVGSPQVGSTLSVRTGAWSPRPTAFRYQWLRAGAAIAGASAPTYTLTAADKGKLVSVRVVPVLAGHGAIGVVPTVDKRVGKATATVSVTSPRTLSRSKRARVKIKVGASGIVPLGTVTVKAGGRTYKATLGSAGKASIKLKRFKRKGNYAVRVTYAGSATTKRAVASVTYIRVNR